MKRTLFVRYDGPRPPVATPADDPRGPWLNPWDRPRATLLERKQVAARGLRVAAIQQPGEAPEAPEATAVEGYASLWGLRDRGGDVVERGAFAASLARLKAGGEAPKLLWQHDPAQPIGVWDEVQEDDRGLWVRGRILADVDRGREAAALVRAGAIDGLSIGYRAVRAAKDAQGLRRLTEVDLWEVSLVTFPMLREARLGDGRAAKSAALIHDLAREVSRTRELLRLP